MSLELSIHPQARHNNGAMRFVAERPFAANNANCVQLKFMSKERRAEYDFDTVDLNLTVFHLSDVDAAVLSTIGLLDAERREKLLPILRDLMNDQTTDAELELEEAANA